MIRCVDRLMKKTQGLKSKWAALVKRKRSRDQEQLLARPTRMEGQMLLEVWKTVEGKLPLSVVALDLLSKMSST